MCAEMCIQRRPFRNALTTLILTTAWVVCATACVSTKRSAGPLSQSVVFPADRPQRESPRIVTSKPRDAAARESASANAPTEKPSGVATSRAPSAVSTGGGGAPAVESTPSRSPSMIVTTTTKRSIDTQADQTSRRVWPFLVGVVIAAAAGFFLLFRRSFLGAR